jgi:hypothetical protein
MDHEKSPGSSPSGWTSTSTVTTTNTDEFWTEFWQHSDSEGKKYFSGAVVPSSGMPQPTVFDCAIERLFSQLLL